MNNAIIKAQFVSSKSYYTINKKNSYYANGKNEDVIIDRQ